MHIEYTNHETGAMFGFRFGFLLTVTNVNSDFQKNSVYDSVMCLIQKWDCSEKTLFDYWNEQILLKKIG